MKIAIIGAGLGGLLAAASLSKDHEVTVYEQLDMYGGRFTNLPYKGFQLTTGAFHMLPHGPTGPLALLLKDLGAKVEIIRSRPEGTVLMKDGKLINAMNFPDALSHGTRLKIPLLAMKALGQKTGTAADFIKGFPDLLPLADSFCGWSLSTTAANTPMAEVAAILKNMQKHGMPGVPMGGCSGVVDALAGIVEDNGGRIILSTKVDSVKVEDGKATGVTANGETAPADAVISNLGHQLTSKLYDQKYLEPKYGEVLSKVKPSAGIKICLAADEPLVGHGGVLFTPHTQRVNGINEVTHIDPSLAPKGKHLTMSHQAMRTNDVQQEIKLGLEDLRKIFPGKKYSVLMVQSYRDDWPVNRIASGYDLGNLTPVRNLYVVGDGAKGKGGIEVEGVALGVRNMLELFEKAHS